jgi:hypothetical protein
MCWESIGEGDPFGGTRPSRPGVREPPQALSSWDSYSMFASSQAMDQKVSFIEAPRVKRGS